MEKYISKYKGAEIDAALDLANSALQPGSLTNYALKSQITELQQSINNKADLNGSAPDLIAGAALSILRTRTSEDIEYSNEYIPAARMLVHAPDCTDRFGSELHVDDSFYPVIKYVNGDVIGGNQMMDIVNGEAYKKETLADGYTKLTFKNDVSSTSTNIFFTKRDVLEANHTYMCILGMKENNFAKGFTNLNFNFNGPWTNVNLTESNNFARVNKCTTTNSPKALQMFYYGSAKAGDYMVIQPSILDLTALFPTDQSFVNSLGTTDVPKVLHRLGISSFTINP